MILLIGVGFINGVAGGDATLNEASGETGDANDSIMPSMPARATRLTSPGFRKGVETAGDGNLNSGLPRLGESTSFSSRAAIRGYYHEGEMNLRNALAGLWAASNGQVQSKEPLTLNTLQYRPISFKSLSSTDT